MRNLRINNPDFKIPEEILNIIALHWQKQDRYAQGEDEGGVFYPTLEEMINKTREFYLRIFHKKGKDKADYVELIEMLCSEAGVTLKSVKDLAIEDVASRSLSESGLDNGFINILIANKLFRPEQNSIQALLELDPLELLAIRGMGSKKVKDAQDYLASLGFVKKDHLFLQK